MNNVVLGGDFLRSKISRLIKAIGAIFLILSFPILIQLLISFSTVILRLVNIQPMLYIVHIRQLSFNDYISIVVSLSSCVCACFIGYITYKLTKSIETYNHLQEQRTTTILRNCIAEEIKSNYEILKDYIEKTEDNRLNITLFYSKSVLGANAPLSYEDISNILFIYKISSQCKRNIELSQEDVDLFKAIDIDKLSKSLN